jgi:hypothetical protein
LREERRLRVFENRVLRRIFGPKKDGVTVEWRKLHNEELNDLYSSLNIVRVVKLRIISWLRRVARMGEGRGLYGVLVGKSGERDHKGNPDLDGGTTLRWFFSKLNVEVWTGLRWLRMGISGRRL